MSNTHRAPAVNPQVPRYSWLNRQDEYGTTGPASQPCTIDPGHGSCTV